MRFINLVIFSFILPAYCYALMENKIEIEVEVKNTGIFDLQTYKIEISYLEANHNKENVILLIHANSASKEFFKSLMLQPVLENYRLLAIDLPGHGKSDKFPRVVENMIKEDSNKLFDHFDNFYTFPGYANIIKHFINQLNIPNGKVNVLGWSLGGHVAIDLVQKIPQIAKVILTGTPINDFEKTATGFNALKNIPVQEPFPRGLTVFDLLSYDKTMTPEQGEALHQLVGIPASDITKTSATVVYPKARFYMIKFAFEAQNQKNKLIQKNYQDQENTVQQNSDKFIVIQGQNDPIKIQGDDADRIKKMGVAIYEIENAGHAITHEKPEEVALFMIQIFK